MYMGAFNSFFSRKLVRSLANLDFSQPVFGEEYINLMLSMGCHTVGDGLAKLYSFLCKYHRNEYVYKNELFNKILLGIHSPRTSTAFEEFAIANSIADFIVLNGSASVYEVKTDLDNFQRLEAQVIDYYSAFDRVTIVCGPKSIDALMNRYGDSTLGILELTDRKTLHWCKKPDSVVDRLNHLSLFNMLRKAERGVVLEELEVKVPNVAPVFYAKESFDRFSIVPMSELYPKCLEVLKRRGDDVDAEAVCSLPRELKLPGYCIRITAEQAARVTKRLSYPL